MKVRITDAELARCIAIGLAVAGKRGRSKDAEVMSQYTPLFPDDFGITRGAEVFVEQHANRKLGAAILTGRSGSNWKAKA